MTSLVRDRFDRDEPTTRALAQVELVADDHQMVEAVSGVLAQRLADAARRDARFAGELRSWMIEATQVINTDGDVTSVITRSRAGGLVVQARDVGNVSFGPPPGDTE